MFRVGLASDVMQLMKAPKLIPPPKARALLNEATLILDKAASESRDLTEFECGQVHQLVDLAGRERWAIHMRDMRAR